MKEETCKIFPNSKDLFDWECINDSVKTKEFIYSYKLSLVSSPLLTQRREGADRAGVPAALPAGFSAAALTHTGTWNTTAPS